MTNITRAELEAGARLLGHTETWSGTPVVSVEPGIVRAFDPLNIATDQLALARAAKLTIDYKDQGVMWERKGGFLFWPADGTEAECIIKAAAAVQIEREKQQ